MKLALHQYVDRESGAILTEELMADKVVNLIYSDLRENAGFLFNLLVSKRTSSLLGFLNYDMPLGRKKERSRIVAREGDIDLSDALDPPETFDSYRKIFERKIRYRESRPMPEGEGIVVSPADSKVLTGSFAPGEPVFIKEKFFNFGELIGEDKGEWRRAFSGGDYAVFRLTPEKYHYNHTPVAGTVKEIYEVPGEYNSCNPGAVVRVVSPYSRNRRVVTVIDTDVPGGTGVGLVAMVEIVALMIGDIVQCYSREAYDVPFKVEQGLFMEKGCPKSLFRPGSSTTVLIFQENRVRFSGDLIQNRNRMDVVSRFSRGFGEPLVETDLRVRSEIGKRID